METQLYVYLAKHDFSACIILCFMLHMDLFSDKRESDGVNPVEVKTEEQSTSYDATSTPPQNLGSKILI